MNLPRLTRLILLPLALGGVLGCVYFLPESGALAQSSIRMELPDSMDSWRFNKMPPSPREVEVLAKDTEFSKAVCVAPKPGEFTSDGRPIGERVDLSIVLSGSDITNSIHRPERCMPAQGHQIYGAHEGTITTPAGHEFPAQELVSMQTLPLDEKGEKTAQLHCVTYYFFVGRNRITNDHVKRTLLDIKDRIVHGQDQRWAYVSASMWFSETGEYNFATKEVAENKIRRFLGELADRNIDWQAVER